jgi:hypothetical protein
MASLVDVTGPAHQAVRANAPWVAFLARLGFASKGAVYLLIGWLAAQSAFGDGGRIVDSRGAMRSVLAQPFGQILLGAISIGLVGYALWYLVMALFDPERRAGESAKGLAKRIGYAGVAFLHAGLAIEAVRLITGARGSGVGAPEHWTAKVLSQPFGPWLVAAIGVCILAFGLFQLYKAYRAKLEQQLDLSPLPGSARSLARGLARFGLAARGIVFSVIGGLVVRAGLTYNPKDAKGIDGALVTLARQPYGPYLLGAVALGVCAYGLYQLLCARYRRIEPAA